MIASPHISAAIAALAAALVQAGSATAVSAQDTRDLGLTVQQTSAYQVAAPATAQRANNALSVTAWVDRENNTYHLGENVQLYVKTNKDAFVTVLNVGPSGNTTVLFPNQFQPDNLVRAGQIKEVPAPGSPAQITVGGPVGTELIKVIASTKSRQVFQQTVLQSAGPWQVVSANVNQWTRDLSITMQAQPGAASTVSTTTTTTQTVEAGEWDSYNKVIRTVPGPQGQSMVPGSVIVPMAPQPQQFVTVAPAMPVPAVPGVVWAHTIVAPGAIPLTVSTPKPVYVTGEAVPVQVVAPVACNLMVVSAGNQVVYPTTGVPVLIQANQPVVINGIASRGTQTLTATCAPVAVSRDIGGGEAPATAQISYTVQ